MEPSESGINLNWDAVDARDFRDVEGRMRVKDSILGGGSADAYVCLVNKSQIVHVYGHRYAFPLSVLRQTSIRDPRGLFGVVSRISPTGADNFEDLTILDSSNPEEWLLVVVLQDDEGFTVYRRFYSGDAR
jgi:hypothetical protein